MKTDELRLWIRKRISEDRDAMGKLRAEREWAKYYYRLGHETALKEVLKKLSSTSATTGSAENIQYKPAALRPRRMP